MNPHEHHHHHRRRWKPGGPGERLWWLTWGIHRRLAVFLVAAITLGIAGGVALHVALGRTVHLGFLAFMAVATLFVAWPLSWMVTWQILRPLRRLTLVAGDLQGGRLERRTDIPEGRDEVGEVGLALRDMADRVAKQLADQRALMAAVSHELRSPLGRARVLVEMGREGSAPATLYADLEEEIEAMDGLVGDLLAAARIDFEAVSRRELQVIDVARRAIEIAGVSVALVEEGPAGTVLADATLLGRALSGLLDNARRHGGPTVVLRIRDLDERVRFEVDDDGPGFAPGDEERAFEPFWRGPKAEGRPTPQGTGLGLALVRQIAAAHGGSAGALTLAGGGARVWIEIPR